MLKNIIQKYENQKCFKTDFCFEVKTRKAYSGERESIERLIQHLRINYSNQVEFIERLDSYLDCMRKNDILCRIQIISSMLSELTLAISNNYEDRNK